MAFKLEPALTHVALMALLKDAVDYLDMKKSFRHEGDYIDAVTHLIEAFPAMKLEEWRIICSGLKSGLYGLKNGSMYERLKLPELVDIFEQFEGERAERREKELEKFKNEQEVYKPQTPEQRAQWQKFVKGLDLPQTPKEPQGRWKHIIYPNTPEE